jgi:hypothetical protein
MIINKCEELAHNLLTYSQIEDVSLFTEEHRVSTHQHPNDIESPEIESPVKPRRKKTRLVTALPILSKLRSRKRQEYKEMD